MTDALQADPDSKSGEGSTGGLPDEGIEGDGGRGTGERRRGCGQRLKRPGLWRLTLEAPLTDTQREQT
jgi:hypothetical protein